MKNDKVFKLIDKFAVLAVADPINDQYQAQLDMLAKFSEHFYGSLRSIITQLGGDISILKDLNFDPKMQKMLGTVHQDLVEITKSINTEKPYQAAKSLVKYVLDKPYSPVISNLDFLAKHHIKINSTDLPNDKIFKHTEINSLDRLKGLAEHLKKFMAEHPLIATPNPTATRRLEDSLEDVPSFTSGKDDLTRH